MKTAHLEIRSQHSRGGSRGFGGPDTYVCVQIVPENSTPLTYLNRKVAEKRGIKLIHFGEGYSNRKETSRSMLGSAIQNGKAFVQKYNHHQDCIQKMEE